MYSCILYVYSIQNLYEVLLSSTVPQVLESDIFGYQFKVMVHLGS